MKDKSIGMIPFLKRKDDYLFLLVLHTTGHWGSPKGHPVANETELETAMRELREETGIKKCYILDNYRYKQSYSFEKSSVMVDKEVIYYLGLINENKASPEKVDKSEIQAIKCLTFAEALTQLTYEDSRIMLKEILVYLHKKGAA